MTDPEAVQRGSTRGLPTQKLRFKVGDQLFCRMEELGGSYVWENGTVVGLWYREIHWPEEHPGAPYEVLLDVGLRVFALVDHDRIIRKHSEPRGGSNSHCRSSRLGNARFLKQADDVPSHGHGHSHDHGHGPSCCHGAHSHGHGHDPNCCHSAHSHGHGHSNGHCHDLDCC